MKKEHMALIWFIGACLFVMHLATIANDVQAVIEDPNHGLRWVRQERIWKLSA